jgi:hypothetical protein
MVTLWAVRVGVLKMVARLLDLITRGYGAWVCSFFTVLITDPITLNHKFLTVIVRIQNSHPSAHSK